MKKRWKSKSAIVSIVAIALIALLLFGGGGHLGLFSEVNVSTEVRGPHTVVGVDHYGSYRRIVRILNEEVKSEIQTRELSEHVVKHCALLYDDPKFVPRHTRHSLIGFLTETEIESVEEPFKLEQVEKRQVVIGTTAAHRSVASYKIYQKLKRWLRQNNYIWEGPALEIYNEDGTVEIEIPYAKAPKRG